jgi:hypothetical protein
MVGDAPRDTQLDVLMSLVLAKMVTIRHIWLIHRFQRVAQQQVLEHRQVVQVEELGVLDYLQLWNDHQVRAKFLKSLSTV